MIALRTFHVNNAFINLTQLLIEEGVEGTSRVGPVVSFPEPVSIAYTHPCALPTLLNKHRRNDPLLDFFEALNSFRANDDATFMSLHFGPRFDGFANYGRFRGHYGTSLRRDHLLTTVIERLYANLEDRRTAMPLLSNYQVLDETSNDVPCNVMILPRVNPVTQKLDLTVVNRSNDMYWGMLGVNYTYFNMLQRLIAHSIGHQQGVLFQFSVNVHAYMEQGPFKRLKSMGYMEDGIFKLAHDNNIQSLPPEYDLLLDRETIYDFLDDVDKFFDNPSFIVYKTWFFNEVVSRMYGLLKCRLDGIFDTDNPFTSLIEKMPCPFWKLAVKIHRENRKTAINSKREG